MVSSNQVGIFLPSWPPPSTSLFFLSSCASQPQIESPKQSVCHVHQATIHTASFKMQNLDSLRDPQLPSQLVMLVNTYLLVSSPRSSQDPDSPGCLSSHQKPHLCVRKEKRHSIIRKRMLSLTCLQCFLVFKALLSHYSHESQEAEH